MWAEAANRRTALCCITFLQLCVLQPVTASLGGLLSPSASVEQCLQGNLRVKCSPGKANSSRGDIAKVIRYCLEGEQPHEDAKPCKILFVQSVLAQKIASAITVYADLTGIPIALDLYGPQALNAARLSSMANAAAISRTHEAWATSLSALGDATAKGQIRDLSDLVSFDKRLKWEGLMPLVRSAALVYNSSVVGMPLTAFTYHLAYQKTVFAKHNLTVPRTWKELADFAVKRNGTGGLHSFCGLWGPCFQLGSVLIRYVLAAYTQTHGSTQGWLFEPNSMKLLLNSPAMTEALNIIQALYNVSPVDDSLAAGCPLHGARFTGGECLMAIVHPMTYKWVSHESNAAGRASSLYGDLGIAPWPGSEQVLDVPTNSLTLCDEKRCPYASRIVRPDGSAALINVSPGLEAAVMTVNAHQSDDRALFTFSLLSDIASPAASDKMVFSPDVEMFPSRGSQLQPNQWLAFGFELNNTLAYCADTLASLQHPNLNIEIRMPGALNFSLLFVEAAQELHQTGNVQSAMDLLISKGKTIVDEVHQGNMTSAKQAYWYSINRDEPPTPAAQVPNPADTNRANVGEQESPGTASALSMANLIIVMVASTAATGFVAIITLWYCYHGHENVRAPKSHLRHPGPGPLTTLLVTDIENSTTLWEELDASVMDVSAKLHNTCLRTLATKHKGYQFVWEGDSVMIAFRSPNLALGFAVAAQKALLHLDWPPALLACELSNEVWAAPEKTPTRMATILRGVASQVATPRISGYTADEQETPLSPSNLVQSSSFSIYVRKSSVSDGPDPGSPQEVVLKRGQSYLPSPTLDSAAPAVTQLGQQMMSEWVICQPGTSGAVCVFRGLRVRMGMHAGIANSSEIRYSTHMKRWHYTGPARTASSAIASAGHGGYILASSNTVRLLGTDEAGLLTGLPPDCNVYHLGWHLLEGVQHPISVSLVLPASLKGRIAVQQDELRTLRCVSPGILQAPLPPPAYSKAAGLTVVTLEICGVSDLLSWSTSRTLTALTSTQQSIQSTLAECNGFMFEDGLSHVLATTSVKPRHALAGSSVPVPGRTTVVFRQPQRAFRFALLLRHEMLHLDWDTVLLKHAQCEQIGLLPQETAHLEATSASLHSSPGASQLNSPMASQGHAMGQLGPEECLRLTLLDQLVGSIQELPWSNTTDADEDACSSDEGLEDLLSKAASEARMRLRSALSAASSSASKLSPLGNASPLSTGRIHQIKAVPGKKTDASSTRMCIIEPIMLRGLRTKAAVVQGSLSLYVALKDSGQAVYSGTALRQAARWMKRAKAGEIVAPAQLVNTCLFPRGGGLGDHQ